MPTRVKILLEDGAKVEQLLQWVQEQRYPLEILRFQQTHTGLMVLHCDFRGINREYRFSMLSRLTRVPGVKEVEVLAEESNR